MNPTRDFWEKAYRENASWLAAVCRRYVSDNQLAEDLMHDAFLTAINKSGSFSGKGAFEAWLRKIAVNTSLTYLRNVKTKQKLNEMLQPESETEMNDEISNTSMRFEIENAEFTREEIVETIELLPEHHRMVFNMYVFDNFTHKEIASMLKITEGTSKSHLARARKRLQHLLYEKLQTHQTAEKRKYRAAYLFLFLFKPKYIDHLVIERSGKYPHTLSQPHPQFFDSIDWNKMTLPIIHQSFFTTKKWFAGAGVVILMVVTVIIFNIQHNKVEIHPAPHENHINLPLKIEMTNENQSSTASKEPVKVIKSSEEDKAPVIVRKKIIQHQTITIHDTINIKDTNHVE